jgi:hypothetical protein
VLVVALAQEFVEFAVELAVGHDQIATGGFGSG